MRTVTLTMLLQLLLNMGLHAQPNVLMQRYSELRSQQGNITLEPTLSSKNLESVNWYFPPQKICDGNTSLTFYKKQFVLQAMHSGEVLYGNYSIRGNIVQCKVAKVFPDTEKLLSFLSLDGKDFELEYRIDKTDFWYSVKLIGKNSQTIFYALGSEAKKNNWYLLEANDVYKYDGGVYSCNGNLNVRADPSTSSAKLYLLKDKMKVNVVGKSKKEEMIDGIKSSWYYVDYAYEDAYCPFYGWVFGGFLVKVNE